MMESKEKPATFSEKWRKIIPNLLTVVRIILVPVFIALMIVQFMQGTVTLLIIALVVFCLAAYTDHLDGKLARRWQVVSDFGKLVDPIADKALMISAFVLLSLFQNLWWWFTAVVILREVAVTLLRMYLLRSGVVLPASKGGKIKTSLQILMVFLWMLAGICYPFNTQVGVVIMYLAIAALIAAFVATVLSGMVYFLDAHDNRKRQAETIGNSENAEEDASEAETEASEKLPEDAASQTGEKAAAEKTSQVAEEEDAEDSADQEEDYEDDEDDELVDDFVNFKKTWIPRIKNNTTPQETADTKAGKLETESLEEETPVSAKPAPQIEKPDQSENHPASSAEDKHQVKFPSRRQRREQQKAQEKKSVAAKGEVAEESSESSIPQVKVEIPDLSARAAAVTNSEDALADDDCAEEETGAATSPGSKAESPAPRFALSRSEMRRRKKEK
ncbi:CDP-diacylglycerol--glycerol-3-phosphate 3-phosphatidyltransferase [uncultured Varibaculum sp.]|uniref:CDP-diacylglycerol--glycerol-3-phosphate 3-phosphatidyltransferase n=1 Tax=uncultured Varibaculum sp. TaxID=413896 RepID=UPI002598563A|nr:CDP-diacylglycerol--glycerol-3-phosphate 3-phosphatidyltransferase [uncultured Varibaculum sp.]